MRLNGDWLNTDRMCSSSRIATHPSVGSYAISPTSSPSSSGSPPVSPLRPTSCNPVRMATLGWAILGVIIINAGFAFFRNTKRNTPFRHFAVCCRARRGSQEAGNSSKPHGAKLCPAMC